MKRLIRLYLCCFVLFCGACASYTKKTQEGIEAFQVRDYQRAEANFKEGAETEGNDQLLYLFERGIVRHLAEDYKASNKDLLLADKLSEIKDYTSLSKQAASILVNDTVVAYKGEEFEHVLISAYLAINFALMGKDEDAIVECRRVNRKLERLRKEAKRSYSLNAFAQYLSGLLYERQGNWNSAYIDYKKAYEINPNFSSLPLDLLKGAIQLRSESEKERWRREMGAKKEDFKTAYKELRDMATIAVIFQNGFSPEKIPSSVWPELPEFSRRYNRHLRAHVYLDGEHMGESEVLFDVESVAFKNLSEKYAGYIAKRVAGVVTREVVGNQVAKQTGSKALGALTKVALTAMSRADLRSWRTLPKDFQIARIAVKPGKYQVSIRLEDTIGAQGEAIDLGEVELKAAGEVALLNYRSLNEL